jgi:hypothetical protein
LTNSRLQIQVNFSPGKILHLKRCFDDIINAAASPIAIHPKMTFVFNDGDLNEWKLVEILEKTKGAAKTLEIVLEIILSGVAYKNLVFYTIMLPP